MAQLEAEKARLETELGTIDAAIAAELALDALDADPASAPSVRSGVAAPARLPEIPTQAPKAVIEPVEVAPRKRVSARAAKAREPASEEPLPAQVRAKAPVADAPVAAESKTVPVAERAAPDAAKNEPPTPAISPADPAVRKPTLGSRLLAALSRKHPNAMNAAQLVEKLRAADLSAPTEVAVLQSLRALRVNGMLWSGDGESFGLTPAGLKRARSS